MSKKNHNRAFSKYCDCEIQGSVTHLELRRLVSEFSRVCERGKLRVNVGKSKVMRCSRYGNGDRMHVILNGEPLEEVDCFKYLGSQSGSRWRM